MGTFRRVFLALPVIFFCGEAQADSLPPLMEQALRYGEAADQIRWGYTSTFTDNQAQLTFRYEPGYGRGNFTLLAPTSLSNDGERIFDHIRQDEDPDSDLTYEQARLVIGDQEPVVVEETDEYVVYEVEPNPWDDLDSDEAAAMSHMMAQMTISKDTGLVTRIRIYNPEPFHAMVVARIDEFEQVMTFEPEPVTGLPLMTSMRQEVTGRALFQRLHQVREETYRDFVPMADNGATLACANAICVSEFLNPQ